MAEPEARAKGLVRGGRILLYLSLLMNFIIIGLVIGAIVSGGDRRGDRGPPRANEMGLGPIVQALSPEDRRALGREMRQTLRDERRTRGELRALMDQIVLALEAEPFDVAEVDALLATQFSEVEFRLGLAQRVFLERLEAMDASERAAFATRLQEVLDSPRTGFRPPDGALEDSKSE
ncbi:MAG: periplasmic heavy metal sensor [Pseudomonadota bacterium]